MRRVLAVTAAAVTATLMSAGPALACGGLIGPNGAVNLTRTTTFAGYANGVEHYVTAFNFAGGTGKFGSITPLPDVPTNIERGGDWTLQRLVRETEPVRQVAAAGAVAETAATTAAAAEVLIETTVDALDITILRGSGDEVGRWAKENGFRLPPDAPEVLDFYARRSAIFMAAAFDADRAAAAGQQVGDGTPIHLTIPTDAPWVPLRILGLGKQAGEPVDADVYLLTERRPAILPAPALVAGSGSGSDSGLLLAYDKRANSQLLRDLHDDKSGDWVPLKNMWLSKIVVQESAGALQYDLAIDPTGAGKPSIEAAGLVIEGVRNPATEVQSTTAAEALATAAPELAAPAVSEPRESNRLPIAVGIGLGLFALATAGVVVAGLRRTP